VNQAIYICITCNELYGTENNCCCINCAEVCHKDHDVNFFTFGYAYCDCGATATSQCRLRTNTSPTFTLDPQIFSLQINTKAFSPYMLQMNQSVDMNTLHRNCEQLVSKTKETFWVGINDSPRCTFEYMALSVLLQHLSALPAGSCTPSVLDGVEWWIQYKEINASSSTVSSDTTSTVDRSYSIDLHYDKDEEVAGKYGIGIFPSISTVTYLTAHELATPTIVFNNTASTPVGDAIREYYVSYPCIGKHIAFAGNLLHGRLLFIKDFIESVVLYSMV
jgi:hypothetical protein